MGNFFKNLFKKNKDAKIEKPEEENMKNLEDMEEEEFLSDEEIEKLIIEEMDQEDQEIQESNEIKESIEIEKEIVKDIEQEKEEEPGINNEVEENEVETKGSFLKKLKDGLFKTRKNITEKLNSVVNSFKSIDEDLFEELEEILITSDVGVETTMRLLDGVRKRVKEEKVSDPKDVIKLLKDEILKLMTENVEPQKDEYPMIIVVMGVNGVGKTTSVGKIANRYKKAGKKVLIAAADTFRAAAIEQLEVWSNRVGVDIIKHQEGSDPAAIIYDAINAGKSRKTDVILCDTAGRLHNKKNLMEELKKIFRIIDREYPEAHREVYLVLDATTGQNAITQAKVFREAADITGIVLTKLDGTAKGGIVIAIKSELNIPVRLVGVGEKIDDLQEFNAEDFVNALFAE
ncbi:signal recognition particle-docking protein FtsY [Lutispora thermophila]|uniref:Signal recognition particle receptor FtsY n=1 Tax=Lutispora thermophila DSM 19022 TaxID=1122184 RepID=A0A1M6G527_9FIRM|nr:signal recognition particle-docking protein FtsY [Lutispora thermophila]SHJ05071.1 signal recognition particle-docking protein FtsY [Lutispora thermophila DSM 19022]